MKKSIIGFVLLTIMLLNFQIGVFAAEQFSISVILGVTELGESAQLDINFSVENNTNEDKDFMCVVVMFDENHGMVDFNSQSVAITAGGTLNTVVSLTVEGDYYKNYLKCFAVEDLSTIRTLGNTRIISNLNPNITEKYTYVNLTEGEEVIMYLKTDDEIYDVEGKHIINYNPESVQIDDLCLLTPERELTVGNIADTGITVETIDTLYGRVVFSITSENGWKGYNNLIRFKALKTVYQEKFVYTVEGETADEE